MHATWRDAVLRGDVEAVRAEVDAGHDVDARDRHGQTALMLAARRGDADMVAALIAAGAALDVTAKYRLSALMLAIVAGEVACARLLARAGADRTLRGAGAPGFAGKTAYDLAVERGLTALAAELDLGPVRS
jgi:ankyrin repeat protein